MEDTEDDEPFFSRRTDTRLSKPMVNTPSQQAGGAQRPRIGRLVLVPAPRCFEAEPSLIRVVAVSKPRIIFPEAEVQPFPTKARHISPSGNRHLPAMGHFGYDRQEVVTEDNHKSTEGRGRQNVKRISWYEAQQLPLDDGHNKNEENHCMTVTEGSPSTTPNNAHRTAEGEDLVRLLPTWQSKFNNMMFYRSTNSEKHEDLSIMRGLQEKCEERSQPSSKYRHLAQWRRIKSPEGNVVQLLPNQQQNINTLMSPRTPQKDFNQSVMKSGQSDTHRRRMEGAEKTYQLPSIQQPVVMSPLFPHTITAQNNVAGGWAFDRRENCEEISQPSYTQSYPAHWPSIENSEAICQLQAIQHPVVNTTSSSSITPQSNLNPSGMKSRRFGREEFCEGRSQPSSIHGKRAESRTQETGQLPPIQPSVIATAIMNTYTSTAQINLNQAVTTVTASRRFGRQEVCQEKWPRARRLGVCANSDNAQEGRTFVRVLNKRF